MTLSRQQQLLEELFLAIRRHAVGMVEPRKISDILDQGADVNGTWTRRMTPLHKAAEEGDVDAVRLLLDRGADPNAEDGFYWTALHFAACLPENSAGSTITEYLLASGAKPDIRNSDQNTPADVASANKSFQIAEKLRAATGLNPQVK